MSHLQSSKGGENKYILFYFKNTLLDDSEFPLLGLDHFDYHYHFDKVEPGVSGQLYTLLGDREKIFAPMRFHRFNVQCNAAVLYIFAEILFARHILSYFMATSSILFFTCPRSFIPASLFLHFMIHILSFRFLGFNIYLHDRW